MRKSVTVLVVFVVFTVLLSACDSRDLMDKLSDAGAQRAASPASGDRHEITEVDVFAIPGIHGDAITVFGVGLGDSKERVLAKLGQPDTLMEFPDIDTVNFQYSQRLNMTNPGLLVQLRNGTVSKITFKQPFNQYLHGSTIIDHSKEDIYFRLLGVPDSQEDHALLRIFYYEDEGFEVFIKKKVMNGFSITAPAMVKSPKRKLDDATLAELQEQLPITRPGTPTVI